MNHLDFKHCLATTNSWTRLEINLDENTHCKNVLLHTDDFVVVNKNTESVLRNEIGKKIELKEESVGPPKTHLGGSARKVHLENDVDA